MFDSWAGALDPDDYERHVLPAMRDVFAGLADLGVPLIHFGVGTGELLALMRAAGGDRDRASTGGCRSTGRGSAWVADARCRATSTPRRAWARGRSWRRRRPTCCAAAGGAGHVFNLGHGVLPGTPPETLERLVDLVHERTAGGE